MSKLPRTFTVLSLGAFAIAVLFRLHLFSGFDFIPGDIWDGNLILGITDHWRRVFLLQQPWDTLPMFWPAQGTLGYSDTFFLQGIVHSLFCALGLDIYTAYTLTLMSFAAAGYTLMYLLLTRVGNTQWLLAAAIAACFVNLSPVVAMGTHFQLTLVWLCPGLLLLAVRAWENGPHAVLYAICCGVLLGTMFFTAFYIPWFLCLFCASCLLVCAIAFTASHHVRDRAAGLVRSLVAARTRILAFCTAFSVSIIPVLFLYIPALHESGGNSYSTLLQMLPEWHDFVNLEPRILAWSWLGEQTGLKLPGHGPELHFGFTPILLLLFLVSLASLLQRLRRGGCGRYEKLLAVSGISILCCWALLLKVDGQSLWYYIFSVTPGASAVRAVFRFNTLLSFFSLLLVADFLNHLLSKKRRAVTAVVCIVVILLFGEQIRKMDKHCQMKRSDLVAFLQSVPPPPPETRAFFVTGNRGNRTWKQICAFRLAQQFNSQSINGFSGLRPRGWTLRDPTSPYYDLSLLQWFDGNIPDGLYQLNLDTGEWSPWSETPHKPNYTIGEDFVRSRKFPESEIGWSGLGDNGVWSEEPSARIPVFLEKEIDKPLVLEMQFGLFLRDRHPSQRIRIRLADGSLLLDREYLFPCGAQDCRIPLPASTIGARELLFFFDLPDAASPLELDGRGDPRHLAIELRSFRIVPAAEIGEDNSVATIPAR